MDDSKIKVIYIAGEGRSGSTLLERMLGQINDIVSVGELRFFWNQGSVGSQLCGCEKPLNECEFWSEVFAPICHNELILKQG